MKRIKISLVAAGVALLAGAGIMSCHKSAKDNRPVLVVSIQPQKYILDQLVGDEFRVVTLMPQGDNPETFEPSTADRMDVEDALAYFITGNLVFEKNLEMTSKDKDKFINTTAGIEPIYGTHSAEAHHATFIPGSVDSIAPDPHMSVSIRNIKQMAHNMAATLMTLDPENSANYMARYGKYAAHLDSVDASFAQRLAASPHHAFLVWHPSLSYFARDYDLRQIVVGEENKETSALTLREIINEAREDSVRSFFFQSDFDNRQAEAVSSSIGAQLVKINTTAYDLESVIGDIVDELTRE